MIKFFAFYTLITSIIYLFVSVKILDSIRDRIVAFGIFIPYIILSLLILLGVN